MIIKASSRGGARQLAAHLTNDEDNQHVELYDMRGFVSDDLHDALLEAHSISKATKCKQFLFSISLSPPQNEDAAPEAFHSALERIESEFGMEDQPRALIFHEKDARRHMHAVYSRIDVNEMKAIHLPYFKNKLRDISREVYLENSWSMPRGLMSSQERNISNFTLEEYQQAKRTGRDPRAIKAAFQESWNTSDSASAFKSALEDRGYHLAKGDRRGFVAMDYKGEVYSIARWAGLKTKQVRERLGEVKHLPDTEETKAYISQKMKPALRRMLHESETKFEKQKASLNEKRKDITNAQRAERKKLDELHRHREVRENQERSQRLSSGLRGLWDRITGTYQKARKQNEDELQASRKRDGEEREKLIGHHLEQQRNFQLYVQNARSKHVAEITRLMRDIEQHQAVEQSIEYRQDREHEFSLS